MKIAAIGGNSAHSPANTRLALVSAYTGGADIVRIAVRLCSSDRLVLAEDDDTGPATGTAGSVRTLNVSELRRLDYSRGFVPRGNEPGEFDFLDRSVADRRLALDVFDEVIDDLPGEAVWWIDLRGAVGDAAFFTHGAELLAALINGRRRAATTIFSCANAQGFARLRELCPEGRFAVYHTGRDTPAGDYALFATKESRDGPALQADLAAIGQAVATGAWPAGAILETSGTVDASLVIAASGIVAALGVQSTFDTASLRPSFVKVDESFGGNVVNRAAFALGYAKANEYATVTWNDGIHIDIAPYDGPMPRDSGSPLEREVERLKWDVINIAREWPFYSGGGFGVLRGITGDFAAEVDYRTREVGQATTLEMAVVNADPGAHRDAPPASFRDKDSFYDPHGAPPFAGVEHDEDDGFRINWNLGTEYDNNQYGRPVGDGRTAHGARMRLERRGQWFAAYYRQAVDSGGAELPPRDWVCVGVTRNGSLNPTVYLRCVGKRWRQEKASDPSQYEPIIANRFSFSNLLITCFPSDRGE